MADTPIVNRATVTAPKDYTLPQSQEILLKAVRADIDGTGAAGSFLPALQLLSSDGVVMWTAVDPALSVAAGASASVTWFPGVSGQSVTSGSGIPPFAALDDYVFKHANTTVTGTGHSSQTNLMIQGNAITLDGATRIQVEFFAPIVEVFDGDVNQAIGFELWDGADGLGGGTDIGTILYVEGGLTSVGGAPSAWTAGHGSYSKSIFTPAAGSHTYSIYVWRNDGSGTCRVFASTFVDGSGNIGPAWYRVTTT